MVSDPNIGVLGCGYHTGIEEASACPCLLAEEGWGLKKRPLEYVPAKLCGGSSGVADTERTISFFFLCSFHLPSWAPSRNEPDLETHIRALPKNFAMILLEDFVFLRNLFHLGEWDVPRNRSCFLPAWLWGAAAEWVPVVVPGEMNTSWHGIRACLQHQVLWEEELHLIFGHRSL